MRAFLLLFSLATSNVLACSMFYDDYVRQGNDIAAFEQEAIETSLRDADSVVIARILSNIDPPTYNDADSEPVIRSGKNPRAGQIAYKNMIRVLEVLKGSRTVGEEIEISIMEPEESDLSRNCSGHANRTWVFRVDAMDRTFKYLLYLKGDVVIRQKLFIEWKEEMTAEEEAELVLRNACITSGCSTTAEP